MNKPSDNGERDMNREFLSSSHGRVSVPLVRTHSPADMAVLRSLLDSAEIPSYVQFQHTSSLFPGITIQGYTDSLISVFEDSLPEAYEVVHEYITMLKHDRQGTPLSSARNVGEFLAMGYVVPSGDNRTLPELLFSRSELTEYTEETGDE
ncbi:DUF2007 domain-containing protein [Spirochaeta africana]|nr:DUF2007 domain-containing protein [Spirochaeta africana]